MRIGVVGIGGTGSAAAMWLARLGHEVTAFEQFALGHDRGSSHGGSRIIRYTYADPLYTRMMREAYPLWRALETETNEELLVPCGGALIGNHAHPALAQARAALDANGIGSQLMNADEAQNRFPALRFAPNEAALFQEDMGYLRPTACIRAHAALAELHGATIFENTPVNEVFETNGQVIVRTETSGEFIFDRVVATAGPWMGALFAALGLPLRVTRQQVVYLMPEASRQEDFAAERFPVWIDAETNYYGFPFDPQMPGVKIASHNAGHDVDPDRLERTVDAAYVAQVQQYAGARFSGLTATVTHTETCLYTNTPDEDFLMDAHPTMPRIFLVSGCSGHGFKFTALLGKLSAEAVTTEMRPEYRARFSLARF